MNTSTASEYLTAPLLTSPGVPLRVAVYSRIADGIRSGVFPSSTALPRETELGLALGVSRTVVREALMLLQEDGLIVTRRGVGRFVADEIPRVGLEELRALDDVLADPAAPAVDVRPGRLERQPLTDFVATHLGLEADAEIWFRESLVLRGGQPVAIVQEYLPAGPAAAAVSDVLDRLLPQAATEASTLLSALTRRAGQIFTAGVCEIAASVAGPTRAELLDIEADAPLLLLTQTALLDGRPAYLAKCAVSSSVGHLSVRQSIPS